MFPHAARFTYKDNKVHMLFNLFDNDSQHVVKVFNRLK